jgi:hypothetical protein
VSKAPYNMSPNSVALSRRTWCLVLPKSYALNSPPKYLIVVSNRFNVASALVLKSILLTAFKAKLNSLSNPIIMSVSSVSTNVAPRPP